MSAPNQSNGRPTDPDAGLGVLANLPHTRPQRSTPRRTAARRAAGASAAEAPPAPRPVTQARPKPKPNPKPKARTKPDPASSRSVPGAKAKAKAKTSVKPKAVPPSRSTANRSPLVKTATSSRASKAAAKSSKRPVRGTSSARAAAPKRPSSRVDDSVPRQGFESEMDRASGPVQPPGGTELVATAAEIVTELAKAGVSTGERLLKDLLGRLPLT